ncbi:MAG: dihydrofolate reductase [Bacteroidales bacterium]|jgi:dihydrofolate reductase|nr:dihydrofolate reductase [Bacteroidales bacterium]
MISIIVAVSDDMGIGRDNDLLWKLPDDLKRFKRLTSGKTVIMGRKTWESLPRRPLPGRRNIVISDIRGEFFDGAETAYSIQDAIDMCLQDEEAFVIGGGSIYRQFMPLADRLYITHVHDTAPADIYFPEIEPEQWETVEKEDHIQAGPDPLHYSYVIYTRKNELA